MDKVVDCVARALMWATRLRADALIARRYFTILRHLRDRPVCEAVLGASSEMTDRALRRVAPDLGDRYSVKITRAT